MVDNFHFLLPFSSLNFLQISLVFRNGNCYSGNFHNDKRSGTGHFQWKATGNSYEGDFVNDKRTGIGTYLYGSGEKYVGGFLNGKKHGLGVSYIKKVDDDCSDEIEKWQEEWNNGSLVSRALLNDETNDSPGSFSFSFFSLSFFSHFIFTDISSELKNMELTSFRTQGGFFFFLNFLFHFSLPLFVSLFILSFPKK